MIRKTMDVVWWATWKVTLFNLRVANRTLGEIQYRQDQLVRTLSPIGRGAAFK